MKKKEEEKKKNMKNKKTADIRGPTLKLHHRQLSVIHCIDMLIGECSVNYRAYPSCSTSSFHVIEMEAVFKSAKKIDQIDVDFYYFL